MRAMWTIPAALWIGLAVAACGDEPGAARTIAPQEPGPDAVGNYCGMLVVNHAGPKGQIFLEGAETPIWFTSVRDTLAFTMLPEEPKNVAAIYVNDMGKATNWEQPEPGAWIAAQEALFVAGSDARGGMGAPEVVPFGDRAAAERFQAAHGGEIYVFSELPERYVLGAADSPAAAAGVDGKADHMEH